MFRPIVSPPVFAFAEGMKMDDGKIMMGNRDMMKDREMMMGKKKIRVLFCYLQEKQGPVLAEPGSFG